jgi:large subunit ribosomal protein L23
MSNIKNYQTILKPIVTEKSSLGSEYNQVTFQVANASSKKEIKEAIENIFKVKVKKVNTLIVKGKRKAFRGIIGRRSNYKKAFITLEDGQTIDINAGI